MSAAKLPQRATCAVCGLPTLLFPGECLPFCSACWQKEEISKQFEAHVRRESIQRVALKQKLEEVMAVNEGRAFLSGMMVKDCDAMILNEVHTDRGEALARAQSLQPSLLEGSTAFVVEVNPEHKRRVVYAWTNFPEGGQMVVSPDKVTPWMGGGD